MTGKKTAVDYDGPRELDGFVDFVKKHVPAAVAVVSATGETDELSLGKDEL